MSKEDYFDRTMRGWICNTAARAHRRLSRWYEIEDLIQEGYICFCNCWKEYPQFDVPEPSAAQRAHFMSLVQSSYIRHLVNLRKYSSYRKSLHYTDKWESLIGAADEASTLMVLFQQAPAEIKAVIDKLASDIELPQYRRYRTSRGFRLRETTRDYWARVLGEPDAEAKLNSYFGT